MPKNKKPLKSPVDNMEELGLKNAASFNECTGLIPTPPENAEADESYRDIYDYGPQNPEERKIFEKK